MSYEKLLDYVSGLEIVDTHEHLPTFEKNRDKNTDVLAEYLFHYMPCDLVSAGLSDEGLVFARDVSKPLTKRWKTVEPYWEASRNTGYARSLDTSVRLLYDIDEINGKTIGRLNEAFLETIRKGGQYERVLKKVSKIRISIEDAGSKAVKEPKDVVDARYFRPVVRCDAFIRVSNRSDLEEVRRRTGVTVHSLDDLKHACEAFVDLNVKAGAVGLKCGLAYVRTLRFDKTGVGEAEEDFKKLFGDANRVWDRPGDWPLKRLQDHMMHYVCSVADERGLPYQIHTGLQEGNGNFICHSEPSLLTNLFMEYRNVRFDLFHIGYPYYNTISALAKNFRNVSVDFCWAHLCSPEASIRALIEYLDAFPANKISGFGGDYAFIDGVAGHAHIARENIAKALYFKVKHGAFDLDRAKELARMILVDNPMRIFNLGA